jgi:hypothetical protein
MFSTKQLFIFVLATALFIVLITPQASLAGFIQAYQATGNLHLEETGAAGSKSRIERQCAADERYVELGLEHSFRFYDYRSSHVGVGSHSR